MRHNQIQLIKNEIATFADDVDEVLYGEHGEIMLERQGTQMNLQLVQDKQFGHCSMKQLFYWLRIVPPRKTSTVTKAPTIC